MFRRWIAALLVLTILCMPAGVFAQTQPLESGAPFEMDAVSVLLMDARTGTVILEENADEQRPVASITKLMTMLLAMEALDEGSISLEQEVTVSEKAAGMGGSQALLDAGGVYTAGELLKSLIVASANDSAVALAELLCGSEEAFAERMNERAQQLGLHATHYVNASGLPAQGQYTSARDVAALSLEVLKHPVYFDYSTIWMDEMRHKNGRVTQLVNTNRLIRFYDGADGVKTGSTNEAGFCISATAKRGEDRFLAVVLGSSTGKERFALAQRLLSYAFDRYTGVTLLKKGESCTQSVGVKGAKIKEFAPVAQDDLSVLMRKGAQGTAEVKLTLPESLHAPIQKGEIVGKAELILEGQVYASIPLAASESIEKRGYFGSLGDVLAGWMKGRQG